MQKFGYEELTETFAEAFVKEAFVKDADVAAAKAKKDKAALDPLVFVAPKSWLLCK